MGWGLEQSMNRGVSDTGDDCNKSDHCGNDDG